MLKAAIIGCGKIADAHAAQIQRIKDCEIIAVCDREELMAKQLFERFRVKQYFNSLEDLLEKSRPDVVHVTTPPQSHFIIARQCLLHGAHVYVEKPFTLDAAEAAELIGLAERKGLRITAGHDDQFRHAALRLRKMVREGFLGGAPVHMESYYGYEISETSSYAKALLGDKRHWVRALPGQLLQNIISHGIARIAEYLTTDDPQVIAYGFVSPALRQLGETEIVDELRVIISENNQTTAYFTFSSQMRPCLHQFRIYGPRNGLLLDQDNETLIRLSGQRRKSYLEHFISPVSFAKQYLGNTTRNLRRFLANDFHMKSGMKVLIDGLYESIRGNAPVPIPYGEILRTARLMDAIFGQIRFRPGDSNQKSANYQEIDEHAEGAVFHSVEHRVARKPLDSHCC
jgi:predicted dehydrogenase